MTDTRALLEDIDTATVSVETAGRLLGCSRNTSYLLAQRGEFPVPIIRLGRQYRVPTAALRKALGIPA